MLPKWELLLLCGSLIRTINTGADTKEYPDIRDLFQDIPELPPLPKNRRLGDKFVMGNITFDLENLDIERLKETVLSLEKQFSNVTAPFKIPKVSNETRKQLLDYPFDISSLNETRRQFHGYPFDIKSLPNETRRQLPMWERDSFYQLLIPTHIWEWQGASAYLTKMRLYDGMIQLIYMARHKIKEMQKVKWFNPQDTSYRIAFLYKRLRKIWKRVMDIKYIMTVYRTAKQPWMWRRAYTFLQLHHRAMKLHEDFLYLWWVLVKLHERYTKALNIFMTRPTSTPEPPLAQPAGPDLTGLEDNFNKLWH